MTLIVGMEIKGPKRDALIGILDGEVTQLFQLESGEKLLIVIESITICNKSLVHIMGRNDITNIGFRYNLDQASGKLDFVH